MLAAGVVKVKLYKGNVIVSGRKSPFSLYDKVRLRLLDARHGLRPSNAAAQACSRITATLLFMSQVIASFEDDKGLYNQADAGGFIKLQVGTTALSHVWPLGPSTLTPCARPLPGASPAHAGREPLQDAGLRGRARRRCFVATSERGARPGGGEGAAGQS
jgi:hypothetical protein